MTSDREDLLVFEDVSKFYGEVLGVNRVDLRIPPGITSLVGPNGSGKTTLMNLMTGLLEPTRGRVRIRGIRPRDPERLFRILGYCTQFDAFPRGVTGRQFVRSFLRVHGLDSAEADRKAREAVAKVGLESAMDRRIAGYSKGMRQRIKLAQAIAHDPEVLVLDEPLNGLDPMARAEIIDLLRAEAGIGRHVVLSSHILHEVDLISDRVVLINHGYVIADGDIRGVRDEMQEAHPVQVLVRCARPSLLAARIFELDSVVEAKILEDRSGLLVHTRDADRFYLLINHLVVEGELEPEGVTPADENVDAVYQYLIGNEESTK